MPSIPDLIDGKARSINSEVASPQSIERAEVASWTYSIFDRKRMLRDQRQPLFRDRTLKQYLDDNIKRFIQFKQRPAHKKPWQSNLASATPNQKLIGVLSRLATKGMEGRVRITEDMTPLEMVRERICNAMLKSAAQKNNDDFQLVLEMLDAGEKGIVIGFEDWYHGKRQIREVIDQDPETGELTFKVKTVKEWNDVRSSLVRPEDFYPGDIYIRPGCIQDMDECYLRTVMNEDEFNAEFGKYPDAEKVRTKSGMNQVNESTPFWRQSDDVGNDQVEVIRRFNKKTDEYIIIANEIWINAQGKSGVQPLPWNHKQLPFWGAVFEPLDTNFFYGRSFIDKMISMCDSQDAIFDRIIDQMTLSVSKPILSDGKASSALTKGFLQPNNVIQTTFVDGKPNFATLPINDPSPVGFSLYNLISQNISNATVSAESIGGGSGKKKSASQNQTEQEAAATLISLFLQMMEFGIREKLRLRFPNQCQFYTLPIHAKDEDEGKRFKRIVLKDEDLGNGKRGNLTIQVTPEASQERVMQKAQMAGTNTEFMEISPSFIRFRNFGYEIDIVPQSSIKMTESQRQILELNFQKVMMELYPDKFDKDGGFDSLVETFGKDPSKLKVKQQQNAPGAGSDQQPGKVPQRPGGGTAIPSLNGNASGQTVASV